ncbi:DUF427 domain-containing protein [Phenylobacterium sp.]|uniref:DUF427 domain-containing protein n=1 Tax=Phenylobacterium sp. TaxID=1871053 RepID=UPI0025DBEA69|nr:DUF427 domain-containing protein [Phenylobacterium sp.]
MKIPGPDHPIVVTPAAGRWRAKYRGHVIADTEDAMALQESTYPKVIYFPRADVSMEVLAHTPRSTHCPYKGDASYYTLNLDGQIAENVVWTYETPYPAMAAIAGRLAFYPNQVEIYPVDDAAVNPRHLDVDVDQAVLHTDSGSGASQREHWPANVSDPAPEGGVR